MTKNISAVLFDLDGTLVDSMWMWGDIDIEYLGRYGLEVPPNLQKEIEGMSFSETAAYFKEQFRIPKTLDEIKQDWTKMAYDKYAHEVPLKPGVKRFLAYLSEEGIPCGIATSNSIDLVEAALKNHGISELFGTICTGCMVPKGKPAPDIYLKAAKDLGAAPEECLVFEDVPMGILAGKNAGMTVCAVKDDFSENQWEEKARLADYTIETYEEMLTELKAGERLALRKKTEGAQA